jgi:hypothetical protein
LGGGRAVALLGDAAVALFADPGGYGGDPSTVSLLIFCFLVGVGGVALIVFAIRRQGGGCSIGRSRKPDRALFDYSGRRNVS